MKGIDCIQEFLPTGYQLSETGVFSVGNRNNTPELVSGPCWISETTKSRTQKEWGRVISFIDYDGELQQIAVAESRVSNNSTNLPSELHDMGLHLIPNMQRHLLKYLASFQLPIEFRRESVSKVGWLDCSDDEPPIYVTPERTIGLTVERQIIFQPEEHSQTLQTMHTGGHLNQWKSAVASKCEHHPNLVFALSAAFSGPLLKLIGQDCGGFHFYGASSKGKTTLLQVAASVWGSGADPANSDVSYISRWNTTGNALEATAAAHNDGLLCLDEMGTCDQRDFGKVIYDLFGGRGKGRLNKNAILQRIRTWRLAALSTGEISVEDKILEEGGKHRIGHQVRMIDVPIGEGVISRSCEDPRNLVNDLKKQTAVYFGTAGPEFVDFLTQVRPCYRELRDEVHTLVDSLAQEITGSRNLESFQERVLKRMCIVAAAGLLAADFRILPFERHTVLKSLSHVWDLWIRDGASRPPLVTSLLNLKEFVLANQSRFINVSEDLTTVRDLVGYTKSESGLRLFLMTDKAFKEAVRGQDVNSVAHELKKRGLLFQNDTNRLKSRHQVGGTRPYFYAIRDSLLEFEG